MKRRSIFNVKCMFVAAVFFGVGSLSSVHADSFFISDSTGHLATVNTTTGAVNLIGTMMDNGQVVPMTDIAVDPIGNLFGMSPTTLYSINASNATITPIGNHGIGGGAPFASGNAMVFASDGTLYAAGGTVTNLFTINTSTGLASGIGDMGSYTSPTTGFPVSVKSSGDLAFHNGELFISVNTNSLRSDALVQVNVATTTPTFKGDMGSTTLPGRFTFGLASVNGALYGAALTSVFVIDPLTGTTSSKVDLDTSTGLTQVFGASAMVPEPATLAVMAVFGVSMLSRRNRRVA